MIPGIQSAGETLRNLPGDLLTTYELSLYLRCNRRSIERLVARGILQPIHLGSHWRFSRAQVIAALSATV
jgi:excisionase family DNA binding protein